LQDQLVLLDRLDQLAQPVLTALLGRRVRTVGLELLGLLAPRVILGRRVRKDCQEW